MTMPSFSSEPPSDRISAIRKSGLLDHSGREQFDLLTEHVRVALKVPVAIVSIVDEDRQVFAGHSGLPSPWNERGETPISHSFCQYVVEKAEPLIVSDANVHELVSQNHAIGDLGVVAYLGVPIALPSGELVGALAAIDTCKREWTQHELDTLITLAKVVEREISVGISELKYRRLFEDMQEGYYIASGIRDGDGQLVDIRFDEINPSFERLTGLAMDNVIGRRLSEVVPSVLAEMIPAYARVLDTGENLLHSNRAPALGRWYENRMSRLEGDRVASVFSDITDRKVDEARQEILSKEMSHRLKNTLAMVQAIATQTLRPVEDRKYVEAFEKRLLTLGSAHDILFRKNWQSAQITDVVTSVVGNTGFNERVDQSGPSVEIGPRATLSTSLILHELTTNAAKYGALSNDRGRVQVVWDVSGEGDEAVLTLCWREIDGPPVVLPEARGFGSKLISMGLIGTGGVTVSYDPSGFAAEMTATLLQLQAE
jgi:PAS domain S-box-containing protein